MSRHIYYNRYADTPGKPYYDLLELVKEREYFVITTNVDHQFQLAGFEKQRLFYTQGDYGLWQCSIPCHQLTYDNEEMVCRMIAEQKDMKIPTGLIPHCPKCGKTMTMNLRSDHTFVQDEGWYAAAARYEEFLHRNMNSEILFFELGVGGNTPGIIKFPFWRMTAQSKNAVYACINLNECYLPAELEEKAICIDGDIGKVLSDLMTREKFNLL